MVKTAPTLGRATTCLKSFGSTLRPTAAAPARSLPAGLGISARNEIFVTTGGIPTTDLAACPGPKALASVLTPRGVSTGQGGFAYARRPGVSNVTCPGYWEIWRRGIA